MKQIFQSWILHFDHRRSKCKPRVGTETRDEIGDKNQERHVGALHASRRDGIPDEKMVKHDVASERRKYEADLLVILRQNK